MALRTAQYILDVNNSNDDSDSSGYRGIEPVVHYSAHPYDNNIGLHLSNLQQSTHEEAQSEISTHIYNHPEESNVNPNNCRFDTKCRLLITIGCLILIVSTISVTTVMLNSSKSDGREVDLGRLTTRLTSCSNFLELGLGETKTVICSLPNVSANANSGLSIERVDMNGSDSGFMMADLLFVKDRTDLIINFTFVNFECTDEGNYSVFILKNGTLTSIHNISVALRGKLDPFSLCQSSYNLDIRGSKEIKCSLQKETNSNYSVRIEKVDGNRSGCMNAELQLEYSSDCHWYNIIFVFYAVTCNDSGNYSIGLMENGTKMRSSHNFSVLVQDKLDPFPPCQSSYNLDIRGSKEINCSFQKETNENYSVCIEKVDGNRSGCMNAELQLEYSSDCYWYNIIFVFHAVTCNDIGNYSIGLMENGTMMRSSHNFSVLVQDKLDPFPLCQSSYNLDIRGSKEIKCSLQKETNENYSVCIEKVDGNRSGCMNAELQLEYSSDCLWYNIIFVFYAVTCNDSGNYSIGLMENGTMMRSSHNFSVLVQDTPDTIQPCNRTFELGLGETRNFTCFLKTGLDHDNGNVFVAKLDVDISNSSSGSLNDYLGFTASSNHDNMIINFTFSNVKCDDEGNYSIEFSENGTLHRIHTFFVEVIGHSTPLERCQKSYNVYFGRSKTFECALERTIEEFTDISIEKDNNQSSGSAIHNLFYKTSSDCGTHNIDFTFVDARCKDEGTYLIKILQNFTVHRLHNFYMSVPVNLQKPQIEKVNVSRGYISGEMMQLKCEATTGCSFKNLEWIRRPEGTDIDIVLPQTITNYTIDDITSTYEVITLFLSELTDQSNGDEYRCRIQGTDVVSDPYVVSIVTGEFCKTREIKCDYRHPSECDVWVVCESNDHPLIYRCSHGLFYKPATNCTCCNGHACEHPDKANCPYG